VLLKLCPDIHVKCIPTEHAGGITCFRLHCLKEMFWWNFKLQSNCKEIEVDGC
jgi:hypothetical protein